MVSSYSRSYCTRGNTPGFLYFKVNNKYPKTSLGLGAQIFRGWNISQFFCAEAKLYQLIFSYKGSSSNISLKVGLSRNKTGHPFIVSTFKSRLLASWQTRCILLRDKIGKFHFDKALLGPLV